MAERTITLNLTPNEELVLAKVVAHIAHKVATVDFPTDLEGCQTIIGKLNGALNSSR